MESFEVEVEVEKVIDKLNRAIDLAIDRTDLDNRDEFLGHLKSALEDIIEAL